VSRSLREDERRTVRVALRLSKQGALSLRELARRLGLSRTRAIEVAIAERLERA
jgi:biotin operon repressor